MSPRLAPLFAAFALMGSVGCSAAEDTTLETKDELAGCESDLGREIVDAGKRGRNTFSGELASTKNRVEAGPFVGGEAISRASDALIRSAKREVIIEFYDIEASSWMGRKLAETVAAVPDSVSVHVLVNPAMDAHFYGTLPESRTDARERLEKLFGNRKNVRVSAWDVKGLLLGVFHSKAIIVDGRHALVTDTNFQSNASPTGEGGKAWFQLATQVEGDIARTIRRDAIDAFQQAGDDVFMSEASLPAASPLGTCAHMAAFGRDAQADEDATANLAYAALFVRARENVNVISPNLNDDRALVALAKATEHAHVRILLSKGFNDQMENLWTQGGTNEDSVGRLRGMAKNPCNLEIRWFGNEGRAIDGNLRYANHAKWASADGTVMMIGSQNLDTQSWKKSREMNLLLDGKSETAPFDAIFEERWNDGEIAHACDSKGSW